MRPDANLTVKVNGRYNRYNARQKCAKGVKQHWKNVQWDECKKLQWYFSRRSGKKKYVTSSISFFYYKIKSNPKGLE